MIFLLFFLLTSHEDEKQTEKQRENVEQFVKRQEKALKFLLMTMSMKGLIISVFLCSQGIPLDRLALALSLVSSNNASLRERRESTKLCNI